MIGVVCARNPGRRNVGMYSVDLAAEQYFRRAGQPFELITHHGHRRVGGLNYRQIERFDDYLHYDVIAFWGDFPQNPVWGTKNFAPRHAKDMGCSLAEGVQAWRRLYLLEGRPTGRRPRFYSIGTCFLGWDTAVDAAGLDRAAYRDCLAGFDAIVPRDVLSAKALRALGLENVRQGFDCASLIGPDTVAVHSSPYFAYAFGRVLDHHAASAVADALSRTLGLKAERIQWLLGKYQIKNLDRRYAQARDRLRKAAFLVTDIYHLALTGLGLGRDVYCVGRPEDGFNDTCGELKKRLLMSMAGSGDDYFTFSGDVHRTPLQISAWISQRMAARPPTKSPGFQSLTHGLQDTLRGIFETESA